MNPTGAAVQATYVWGAPPPAQQGAILNCSFTIPETIFMAFVKNSVEKSLAEGQQVMYIGASESMQKGLCLWVEKTFTAIQFSAEELNVVTLVTSIWEKTKNTIETQLKVTGEPKDLEYEKFLRSLGDQMLTDAALLKPNGKIFTELQARFMLQSLDAISKTQ